jgi:hypothetical protein
MRRRLFVTIAAIGPALLSGLTQAQAAPPVEQRWSRVLPADLDRFEASFGNVRINNIDLARDASAEANGPATPHDFTVSVANRNPDWRRVIVQIVGARQDGLPTLSAEGQVDVNGRSNDTVRVRLLLNEGDQRATAVYYIRALALPQN